MWLYKYNCFRTFEAFCFQVPHHIICKISWLSQAKVKKGTASSSGSNEYGYNFNNDGILSLRAFSFSMIFMLSHLDTLVTSLINKGKRAGNNPLTGGKAHICGFWTSFRQPSWRLHDEWAATDWSYCAFVILLHFFKILPLVCRRYFWWSKADVWHTYQVKIEQWVFTPGLVGLMTVS